MPGLRVMKLVGYYRVSTRKQSRSGLGLEAQQQAVRAYAEQHGELIGEFIEVESGKNDNRLQLQKGMAFAKRSSAALIIARLDRFSRRVSFIATMMETGIKLVIADMPNASDFQLHIFAALAQEERRLISERTKAALSQAKMRGQQLGKNGEVLAIHNRARADQYARAIASALPGGWETMGYSEIARRLNTSGNQSPTGRAFYPQTVKSLLRRLALADSEICAHREGDMR